MHSASILALTLLTLLARPADAQERRAIIVLQLDDLADGMPSGQPGISLYEHQRR